MTENGQGRLWLWNQRSTRLAEFFHATRSIAVELERSLDTESRLHSQTLDKAIQTLERSAFRVMVFGDFSSGKSTLINALLGTELLPMKENPTTAFTTVVGYGEEESATLYQHLEPGTPSLPVTVQQFQQMVQLRLDEDGRPIESPYLWGEVRGSYGLLKDNVELIDSAGTNESAAREDVTLAFLPQVDAIIFVTPARGAFKNRDVEHYLKLLGDLGHREIFFAVNQFDVIKPREREEVKRRCRSIAQAYTRRPDRRLFFVSAYDALEARTAREPDHEADRASGLPALEEELSDFLVVDKSKIKLLRPAELLGHQIVQLHGLINERRGLLTKDADELRENLNSSRDRRESLRETLERIRKALEAWVAESEQQLGVELESFIRGLVPEVPRWLPGRHRVRVRLHKGDRVQRYAEAIEEIDQLLNRRLQDELRHFAAGEGGRLETFMREREEALERSVLPLIETYANDLEALRGELTGSRRMVDDGSVRQWLRDMSMHVPDRVLARTSPMLSWGNAAGVAGVGSAGAAAGVGLFTLGLVSWVAAPVVLSAGAIVVVSARLAKKRLQEQATKEYAEALSSGAPRIARQYADRSATDLRDWTGLLERELEGRLGALIAATESAIATHEAGQSEVEAERRRLDAWDMKLNQIENRLVDFKRPLLEEMS